VSLRDGSKRAKVKKASSVIARARQTGNEIRNLAAGGIPFVIARVVVEREKQVRNNPGIRRRSCGENKGIQRGK
jgi:hypothetical protein